MIHYDVTGEISINFPVPNRFRVFLYNYIACELVCTVVAPS